MNTISQNCCKNWFGHTIEKRKKNFYSAGECVLCGLLRQGPTVKALIFGYEAPQYLQVYFDFSDPSYNSCFFPYGFRLQGPTVKALIFGYEAPHHLQ